MSSKALYASFGAKQSQSVKIPVSCKCAVCMTVKPTGQFSNKQLDDLRQRLSRSARKLEPQKEGLITCRACTPGQTEELTCIGCDQTKSLDDFAKTQRRNPDRAECKICVAKRISTEPGENDAPSLKASSNATNTTGSLVDFADSDSDVSNPYEHDQDTSDRLGSTLHKMSLNGKNSQGTSQAEPGWVYQARAGPSDASRRGENTLHTTTASSRHAMNSTGRRQPSSAAAPHAASTTSNRRGPGSYSGSFAGSAQSSVAPKTAKTGWAKPSRGPTVIDESVAGLDEESDDDWGKNAGEDVTVLDEDDLP